MNSHQLLREEISTHISRSISDPRLGFVTVIGVETSPDLRHAHVYVKPLLGANEDAVLKALRTNTAYFQKEVAGKLRLKLARDGAARAAALGSGYYASASEAFTGLTRLSVIEPEAQLFAEYQDAYQAWCELLPR